MESRKLIESETKIKTNKAPRSSLSGGFHKIVLVCLPALLLNESWNYIGQAACQRRTAGGETGSSNEQQQTRAPALAGEFPSSRPLERPRLSVASGALVDGKNLSLPEGVADWFMLGGGDLASDEGRQHALFSIHADEARPHRRQNITSTRRMAEFRHRKSGSASSRNKTQFDDDNSANDAAESNSSNEIYDDVESDGSSLAGTQKEPECAAHGRYYCTFKEDYPLKLVTEVTKYYKWPLEKLFRDLHAQIMPKLAQDSTGNLVCDSITRVVRPGWARNTNERWLVVINTDNYHQYVTEVVCQYGTNSRCNFIPPCYYSSCQQRYNTQKLLVIDPTNPYRGPFLSEFLFPSCCVCYVPSSSDSFQDKYRSSPATIYQRTMQQEAASNLNPPQFRPPGLSLLDEAAAAATFGASGAGQSGATGVLLQANTGSGAGSVPAASSLSAASSSVPNGGGGGAGAGLGSAGGGKSLSSANQPLGPGEIRRAGEQYNRAARQQHSHQQQPQLEAQLLVAEESSRRARQLAESLAHANDYIQRSGYTQHDEPADTIPFPRLGLVDAAGPAHPEVAAAAATSKK